MITTADVIALTRLRHLSPEEAAERMGRTLAEVREIMVVGAIPMTYPPDPPRPERSPAERAAERERWPLKMQKRREQG